MLPTEYIHLHEVSICIIYLHILIKKSRKSNVLADLRGSGGSVESRGGERKGGGGEKQSF